jgi:ataxin-3
LKIYNSEIVPLKKSEAENLLNGNMDNLEAFIFNSSTHWFCIRRIENIWFNLNSTNPGPGPQIISDFYLSAFIKGTEELGYTNFLVKNLPPLPDLDSDVYKNLTFNQKLVSIEDIIKYKPKKINMGDTDDDALEKALELSKKLYEKQHGTELYIPQNGKYS